MGEGIPIGPQAWCDVGRLLFIAIIVAAFRSLLRPIIIGHVFNEPYWPWALGYMDVAIPVERIVIGPIHGRHDHRFLTVAMGTRGLRVRGYLGPERLVGL